MPSLELSGAEIPDAHPLLTGYVVGNPYEVAYAAVEAAEILLLSSDCPEGWLAPTRVDREHDKKEVNISCIPAVKALSKASNTKST